MAKLNAAGKAAAAKKTAANKSAATTKLALKSETKQAKQWGTAAGKKDSGISADGKKVTSRKRLGVQQSMGTDHGPKGIQSPAKQKAYSDAKNKAGASMAAKKSTKTAGTVAKQSKANASKAKRVSNSAAAKSAPKMVQG